MTIRKNKFHFKRYFLMALLKIDNYVSNWNVYFFLMQTNKANIQNVPIRRSGFRVHIGYM